MKYVKVYRDSGPEDEDRLFVSIVPYPETDPWQGRFECLGHLPVELTEEDRLHNKALEALIVVGHAAAPGGYNQLKMLFEELIEFGMKLQRDVDTGALRNSESPVQTS